MVANKSIFLVLVVICLARSALSEDEVTTSDTPTQVLSADLPDEIIPLLIQETGGNGQNCRQFGIPIPATVCSSGCVAPSPIGSCDSGLSCCIIAMG